jgi:hypothetical protein
MSSSSSLVITVSFVLLTLTGSVGALAMFTSQPPASETVKQPDRARSPGLVVEAPGGGTPAFDGVPAPAEPNPPAPGPAGSTPGDFHPQASVKASAQPVPAAKPGPGPERVVPGQVVSPVLPRAFKVECERDRLAVRQGWTVTFDCTLDGWIAAPTNVPIWFSSDPGGGPCDGTQAFSASLDVIRRSPLQAPTPFTVTVDARGGGFAGGRVRVGTPWEASDDLVEITVEAAPGDQHPACNRGNQSL